MEGARRMSAGSGRRGRPRTAHPAVITLVITSTPTPPLAAPTAGGHRGGALAAHASARSAQDKFVVAAIFNLVPHPSCRRPTATSMVGRVTSRPTVCVCLLPPGGRQPRPRATILGEEVARPWRGGSWPTIRWGGLGVWSCASAPEVLVQGGRCWVRMVSGRLGTRARLAMAARDGQGTAAEWRQAAIGAVQPGAARCTQGKPRSAGDERGRRRIAAQSRTAEWAKGSTWLSGTVGRDRTTPREGMNVDLDSFTALACIRSPPRTPRTTTTSYCRQQGGGLAKGGVGGADRDRAWWGRGPSPQHAAVPLWDNQCETAETRAACLGIVTLAVGFAAVFSSLFGWFGNRGCGGARVRKKNGRAKVEAASCACDTRPGGCTCKAHRRGVEAAPPRWPALEGRRRCGTQNWAQKVHGAAADRGLLAAGRLRRPPRPPQAR